MRLKRSNIYVTLLEYFRKEELFLFQRNVRTPPKAQHIIDTECRPIREQEIQYAFTINFNSVSVT